MQLIYCQSHGFTQEPLSIRHPRLFLLLIYVNSSVIPNTHSLAWWSGSTPWAGHPSGTLKHTLQSHPLVSEGPGTQYNITKSGLNKMKLIKRGMRCSTVVFPCHMRQQGLIHTCLYTLKLFAPLPLFSSQMTHLSHLLQLLSTSTIHECRLCKSSNMLNPLLALAEQNLSDAEESPFKEHGKPMKVDRL